MSIRHWGAGLALLALAGCGKPVTTGSDGAGPLPISSASAEPPPVASSAATRPPPAEPAVSGNGDSPPNHVDNTAWKQRKALPPEKKREGEAAAARIRQPLEDLRAAGNYAPEATQQALTRLGYQDVGVGGMNDPTQPGVTFGFSIGGACVFGDVRPARVLIGVDGPIADGGCMEPVAH